MATNLFITNKPSQKREKKNGQELRKGSGKILNKPKLDMRRIS